MKKESTHDEFMVIMSIVERADKKGLMMFDRLALSMDLDCAHSIFNLRLEELLQADDFNFSHDIVGIQNNINRRTMKIENCFVPRYASHNT